MILRDGPYSEAILFAAIQEQLFKGKKAANPHVSCISHTCCSIPTAAAITVAYRVFKVNEFLVGITKEKTYRALEHNLTQCVRVEILCHITMNHCIPQKNHTHDGDDEQRGKFWPSRGFDFAP